MDFFREKHTPEPRVWAATEGSTAAGLPRCGSLYGLRLSRLMGGRIIPIIWGKRWKFQALGHCSCFGFDGPPATFTALLRVHSLAEVLREPHEQ